MFDPANLFLVDDGSSDGTARMVGDLLPGATIVPGNGDLFWNGGMRLAWTEARKTGRRFDCYLWLNDDVTLRPDALAMLAADLGKCVAPGAPVIIAGSTVDPVSRKVNYGGHLRPSALRPLRLALIEPNGEPVRIDTISGNVVLVSAAAERILGNLSAKFKHIYGDLDYGYRAAKAGIPIFLASHVAGECQDNAVTGSSIDRSQPRWRRLRARFLEEWKVHASDWRRFARTHSRMGPFSIIYSITPYLRILANR